MFQQTAPCMRISRTDVLKIKKKAKKFHEKGEKYSLRVS